MIPLRNFGRFSSKVFKQPGYAFQVAFKRSKAYLAYNLSKGKSSFPESITLFMTHRCNLRCKMCGQWGEGGVTKEMDSSIIREELPLDKLKALVDDIAPHGTSVTLFGGEPLLNSHCIDLIRHIKSRKLHCLMITNGSLLNKYADNLVDAGLDELNLSLDGGQVLHDEIRGMEGLFDRIVSGLAKLNEVKESKRSPKPLINLQCTITSYNYNHLEQLIDVAKQIKANSLTYHNLIFLNRDIIQKQKEIDEKLSASSKEWEGFVFDPEINPEELWTKIESIKSQTYPFSVDFYPNFSKEGLKEYYNNPSYKPSEYPGRCVSPWIVAYIFPNGDVRPCLNSSYSFGNIVEKNFRDIWNSPAAVKFRTALKSNKIFPACVRCTELYRY